MYNTLLKNSGTVIEFNFPHHLESVRRGSIIYKCIYQSPVILISSSVSYLGLEMIFLDCIAASTNIPIEIGIGVQTNLFFLSPEFNSSLLTLMVCRLIKPLADWGNPAIDIESDSTEKHSEKAETVSQELLDLPQYSLTILEMISNLTLIPDSGSFIRGYAGITPQLILSGEVRFDSSRDVEVLYIEVSFKGLVKTQITVSTLKFIQEEVIYDMSTRLVNGDPPTKYEKGTHVMPFIMIIDKPQQLSNYSSPYISERMTDGAFITFDLEVEVQYKGGLFGKKYIEKTIEPINIPSIKLEQVWAALEPQVLEFEEIIANDKVMIRFDKHAIFVGSNLNIKIDTAGAVEFLKAQLIQTETVFCQGQVRRIDYVLAESTPVKKSGKIKIPVSSRISIDIPLRDSRIKNPKSIWKSVDVVTAFSHKMVSVSHQLKATFTISGRTEEALLPVLVLDLDQETLDSLKSFTNNA